MNKVTILTGDPVIECIAEMSISDLMGFKKWVQEHRPQCGVESFSDLWPRDKGARRGESANEALVELAGRKCYDSFGAAAGRKDNAEYIRNTQAGDVAHASILYHAKMSFFFAGLSRRVSHEIIRNYVGSDRDEEGSPSQESTRFTHHHGYFVLPPRYIHDEHMQITFRRAMERAYLTYTDIVEYEFSMAPSPPKGMAKKRIYEAASSLLPHAAETSFVWTTNPAAIAKFVRERSHDSSDLEIQRFAKKWRDICVKRWPNLFPQPWMVKA